jgi:hypothetical protein
VLFITPFVALGALVQLLVDACAPNPADTPMLKNFRRRSLPSLLLPPHPRFLLPTVEETRRVWALLEEVAGPAVRSPGVLLNPKLQRHAPPLRRWPTERFVALARAHFSPLTRTVTLVITGAPVPEAAAADAVRRGSIRRRVRELGGAHDHCRDKMLVLYTRWPTCW